MPGVCPLCLEGPCGKSLSCLSTWATAPRWRWRPGRTALGVRLRAALGLVDPTLVRLGRLQLATGRGACMVR